MTFFRYSRLADSFSLSWFLSSLQGNKTRFRPQLHRRDSALYSKSTKASLGTRLSNSEFKKRLRLRVRYKTIGFNEQTNGLHVRYNFWYISSPYSAKQQREMTKFKFYGVRGTHDGVFLILCLNLNAIHSNYVPR